MPNTTEVHMKILKLDAKSYTKAIQAAVNKQMREAAREWLRAVILNVPVYSGQAAASLVPLGRYLDIAIPISPDAKATRRYPNAVSIGESQGTFAFTQDGYTSVFAFSTEVPHYLINEFNVGLGSPPLRNPTPWRSFEAGKTAFSEYMRENLRAKIPKISEFVTNG